ncbi:MAG: hypothetical protein A2231_01175 [Candidatus Firestonebacteria bacterium RIFOXYA2_FULL_40_8]|nr:MAG: hypothetical protein A2231_01175 [Candidatus Firestonebacteria bacterium RIFOXYA2_FULL_40_8]
MKSNIYLKIIICSFLVFSIGGVRDAKGENKNDYLVHGELLSNVVEKSDIPSRGLKEPQMVITSFSELNNDDIYLIAYYKLQKGEMCLERNIYLSLYDKKTKTWKENNIKDIDSGSITNIQRFEKNIFGLYLHSNPSAGIAVIIDKDLKNINGVPGQVLCLMNDIIIYCGNEIHFAPTHYTQIFAKDLRQKPGWETKIYGKQTITNPTKGVKIFPKAPFGKTREKFMARVKDCYDKFLSANPGGINHYFDPEKFNCYLKSEKFCNNETNSMYLEIVYDKEHFAELDYPAEDFKDIVCIFSGLNKIESIKYKEMKKEELEKNYGKLDPKDYLKEEILNNIYNKDPEPR